MILNYQTLILPLLKVVIDERKNKLNEIVDALITN
jgi:hypothetical protein